LTETFKIRTILDLRTTTEHVEQSKKRDARIQSSPVAMQSDEEITRPLQIPGINYILVNFNGSAYSRHLISQLSWWDFLRLVSLMAVGRRLEAISVLGTRVMNDKGLKRLAIDSIDVCHCEVKQVFDTLADKSKYPILIHCTQGKDRTGIVVQLVLMLLGVPTSAINHDYMQTSAELEPEREEKRREIHSIGLTDEFADCDPDLVKAVDTHIKEKYGSVERYLIQAGVSEETQSQLRGILAG